MYQRIVFCTYLCSVLHEQHTRTIERHSLAAQSSRPYNPPLLLAGSVRRAATREQTHLAMWLMPLSSSSSFRGECVHTPEPVCYVCYSAVIFIPREEKKTHTKTARNLTRFIYYTFAYILYNI